MSSSSSPGRAARSLLFVPGDRPDRFAKACASGAHQVILDLEDAVAPERKDLARNAVSIWLADSGAPALVRINGVDTPWFDADLAMVRGAPAATVMLPKAEPDVVAQVAGALPGARIVALVETVAGVLGLPAIAGSPGVCRIAFGSVDFAMDSGISDEGDALTAIRNQIVLASRHAGLAAPVDGVSVEFSDEARMRADASRSRLLGFGGKLCIHPRQVGIVNATYQPTPAEIDWALRVLTAFRASAGGATALDGKMIDKPVVERARRICADAGVAEPA